MKNYLTEFIGTFFLVLTVGLTVTSGTPLAPLAIGTSLMVMVYMGGHISGAHYNPAISLALAIRGALAWAQLVPYWVSQIAGALAAAFVVRFVTGRTFAPAPGTDVAFGVALLIEFLFTFALSLVVLSSATAKKTAGNSFYGLAIGSTIVVAAFAGGPLSGGAFNPAVGLGPIVVNALSGAGDYADLWLYLVGPLLGAAVAAFVFRFQESEA
ncbi:MAG: aquaporin [Candidatus Eisenbacteria bacterium]